MGSNERLTAALAGHSRIALDTAPLIYFLGGYGPRDAVVEEILVWASEGRIEIVVSVVTEAELLVGALGPSGGDAAAIDRLLGGPGIEVVPVTRSTARVAASLRAPQRLGLADAVVAATALTSGCTALVANDPAFRRLDDRLACVHLDDLVGDDDLVGERPDGPPRA